MAGLKQQEIKRLIHEYIGVKMGDLQDFSFASLKDFYGQYCDLDINTDDYEGTKRQRFESILQKVGSDSQAKIIRGTLKKLPPDAKNPLRTQEQRKHGSPQGTARRAGGYARHQHGPDDSALHRFEAAVTRGKPLMTELTLPAFSSVFRRTIYVPRTPYHSWESRIIE